MGALFRARQVIIWTDVDGVYSADLRKVGDVVILKTLSYQEAWGMVIRYGIPIIIRNVFNLSSSGTKICHPSIIGDEDKQIFKNYVKGITTIDNLALVNVEG
ncbi:Bifunctional aspartokinase/homoserine dehydrogenase, chloroplastic isoform A [Glycine soja]|uniref:Bifunctional aspartokinase/homoserine dehydrogenase, chloroplastic isoform A n=1 Tax=Glycine soja TaxID=3848 RepID=A0A445HGQ2_GLYSO|nr:Bifunctional aspartokinase/homoserine dehydrogenase, chloroplastic isoform A [Glycine soja]